MTKKRKHCSGQSKFKLALEDVKEAHTTNKIASALKIQQLTMIAFLVCCWLQNRKVVKIVAGYLRKIIAYRKQEVRHVVIRTALSIVISLFISACVPYKSELHSENQRVTQIDSEAMEINVEKSSSVSVESLSFQTIALAYHNHQNESIDDREYTYLQVDVVLNVVDETPVGVQALLLSEQGELLTIGSLDPMPERTAPLTSTVLKTGEETISIYFRGSDIGRTGIAPPYRFTLRLFVVDGDLLLEAESVIADFDQTINKEGIKVLAISDIGVSNSEVPGYDFLRVTIESIATSEGSLLVQGQLFASDFLLTDLTKLFVYQKGQTAFALDFPAADIAANSIDGPYTLYLTLDQGSNIIHYVYATNAYQARQFRMPLAFFTGSMSERGVDANGNGRYEKLNVDVEVMTLSGTSLKLYGRLESAGSVIELSEEELPPSNESLIVTLTFTGSTIQRQGINGPFQIYLFLVDAANQEVTNIYYVTRNYMFSDFE